MERHQACLWCYTLVVSLWVQSRQEKGVTVVEARGRMILQYGSAVHDEVKRVVEEGARRVLVDLSGVDYIDSYGLGQMVGCMKSVREHEGKLRFAGLSDKVRKLVELSAVFKILEIDPDKATSLARLSGA